MGWILVDSGYGAHFTDVTSRFPERMYRWVTPTCETDSTKAILARAGIEPDEIRHIIITHFHADHVGGLSEFPNAAIYFRGDSLRPLESLTRLRQVRAAFLRGLIPDWLPDQAVVLDETRFERRSDFHFETWDLFSDGSITLVHLPGHAPGQVGLRFDCAGARVLYAADAFWRSCQIKDATEPWRLAMALQWNIAAYRHTVIGLRDLHQRGEYRIIACHDEGVTAFLNELGARR